MRVPPRERIVLAVLLLAGQRVVSMDHLVDAVWDDRPPPTARKQILICVSVLRRLLRNHGFRGELAAQQPGYVMRLDIAGGDRLDLQEFEAEVLRARDATGIPPNEAAESLRRALALWRGEPLAGMRGWLVEAAAVELVERKLAVAEQYAELRLRDGVDQDIDHGFVEDLRQLVAKHPTREALYTQLMRALAQAGRKVEAAEVYHRARRTFMDQFGLEPGEELVSAMSAVLTGLSGRPGGADRGLVQSRGLVRSRGLSA